MMSEQEKQKMWMCIQHLALGMGVLNKNFKDLCGALERAGVIETRYENGETPNSGQEPSEDYDDTEGGDYGGNNTLN